MKLPSHCRHKDGSVYLNIMSINTSLLDGGDHIPNSQMIASPGIWNRTEKLRVVIHCKILLYLNTRELWLTIPSRNCFINSKIGRNWFCSANRHSIWKISQFPLQPLIVCQWWTPRVRNTVKALAWYIYWDTLSWRDWWHNMFIMELCPVELIMGKSCGGEMGKTLFLKISLRCYTVFPVINGKFTEFVAVVYL